MGRSLLRQEYQIRNSDLYDDTLASGSSLETQTSIEGDLNGVRSQLKRILGTSDWFSALSGRSLAGLHTDLADIEDKKILCRVEVLTDITVSASQNWEILSVASSEAPALVAAVLAGTNGAVVAQSALANAAFNVHELIEVAGTNAISPKNLVLIRDASTGQIIQSSERDVYGLLQYESTGTDGGSFNDTGGGNRVKISFVRMTSGFDDLEAVPVADIENKTINYSYTRRINFDAIPEDCFLTNLIFSDQTASVDVTLDRAIDNQGTTPATQSGNRIWRISDTFRLDFEDGAGADLISFQSNSAGTSVIQIGTATDSFDCDAAANDFLEGATFDSGSASPIKIGMTAGYVSTDSADLGVRAGGELYLDDSNQPGSWAQSAGIKLSDTSTEWSDFETVFGGEVSLLRAIYLARQSSAITKRVAEVTTNVSSNVNVTGAGGSPNIDLQLQDYSTVTFVDDVDVYINGQLLRNGANAGANHDVYPGDSPANGDLKFEFNIKSGDVITMFVRGA